MFSWTIFSDSNGEVIGRLNDMDIDQLERVMYSLPPVRYINVSLPGAPEIRLEGTLTDLFSVLKGGTAPKFSQYYLCLEGWYIQITVR